MARITDVLASGTLENLVLYRRMGKACFRMRRSHINQTPATRSRSRNFGIAARAAKGLRSGLQEVMPFPTDRSMQSRFSGAIARWLGQKNAEELPPVNPVPYLCGFQFTTGATFTERFKVPLTVSRTSDTIITVHIDAFIPASGAVAAPAGTASINCTLSVAGCLLSGGTATGSYTHSFSFPFNHEEVPAQELAFPVPTPPGSLTVTAARLEYIILHNNHPQPTDNAAFMPAGVVGASYV